MRRIDTTEPQPGFAMVGTTVRSQVGMLMLSPGGRMGGPETRHERSEHWLYVVSGRGTADVDGEAVELAPGTLLLVEPGEQREITNHGDVPLVCVNVYTPPAY